MAEIRFRILTTESGEERGLADAWVYWRVGGNDPIFLRTDAQGYPYRCRADGDQTKPWDYLQSSGAQPFMTEAETPAEVYYSRGAEPIPVEQLSYRQDVYYEAHITGVAPVPVGAVQTVMLRRARVRTGGHRPNAFRAGPVLKLPERRIRLTKPRELHIWPVWWDLPTDAYHIHGLPQTGNSIFQNANAADQNLVPLLDEHAVIRGPTGPDANDVRPRERGLIVEGTLDSGLTNVRIMILDTDGDPLGLKPTATAAEAQWVNAPPPAGGAAGSFSASFHFSTDAPEKFGPVQILVIADDTNRTDGYHRSLESFTAYLVGAQIALVDDYSANTDGQHRGPVLGEAQERLVLDFTDSPRLTTLQLSDQARCRRMVTYQIQYDARELVRINPGRPGNVAADVQTPQMPLWMAEFQLVRLSPDGFKDLGARRYFREHGVTQAQPPPREVFRLVLNWRLTLSWNGSDVNETVMQSNPDVQRHDQHYQYRATFEESQTVNIHFTAHLDDVTLTNEAGLGLTNADGEPVGIGDGPIPNATDATAVPFPVAPPGRRPPEVLLPGHRCAWGRHRAIPDGADAEEEAEKSLVIEFQPRIVGPPGDPRAGQEIIRGGNGVMELYDISVDGERINQVRGDDAGGALVAPTGPTVTRLPVVRVRGQNVAPADAQHAVRAIVNDEFIPGIGNPVHAMLPGIVWRNTAAIICVRESGSHQFLHNSRWPFRHRRRRFRNMTWKMELDMPKFGPPHGYGIGQIDRPPVDNGNDHEPAWNYLANIRRAVRIMFDKARAAYNGTFHLNAGPHTPDEAAGAAAFNDPALTVRRRRAIFRREVVRRYNGGTEFVFEALPGGGPKEWVIHTTSARHDYPDNVLGTAVGPYPGPIRFSVDGTGSYIDAEYGPDI